MLFRSFLVFGLLFAGRLLGSGLDPQCCHGVPRSRSDEIPRNHIAGMCDEYMTGYVQSLIDAHYFEFQVRVIVHDGIVYVFNLPNNALIGQSILCFIYDIPCVEGVEQVCDAPEDFLCSLRQADPDAACYMESSKVYELLCAPPNRCRISAIWFPQNTLLFQPLIADPRQVMNAASLRFNDNVVGKYVGAPSFGDDFIVIRLKDILWWRGDMDLGVEAGIFAVFDLDHPEACLVNTDFFIAALVTYAYEKWSYRFRFWHLSSHIGDEFLLSNPEFDRRNLSDEGADFFASYQLGKGVRLYAGIGYIWDRDDEFPEEPLYLEWGTEVRAFGARDCFNRLYVQPFLAMHFRVWEEHDYDIDQTYALGVEWSKIQGVGRKFRIYLEYHDGYSKEGQFVRERSNYFAIKVNFGF
ncbi:MAG: hypothetical protein K940chlam9_01827 [Chlamydiae bacterium]|nr:hypothetical protein [Chlamydiota bacterium]